MIVLQPIAPANAAIFKEVRLRALLDTPTAFGSRHAKEIRLSDADWQSRAAQWSGERSAGYLALDGDTACGIAAGFLDEQDPTTAHLVSMWVAPTHRKRGVGKQLVTAIIDWARRKRASRLCLMVTSNNEVAQRFYQRLGFVRTGRTEPYPNDPALVESEMARPIEPAEQISKRILFEPIDLRRNSALCVAHRADATACSDGNPDRFFSEAGPGGERYIEALASAIQDLPGSCVHAVLDGRIIGQIEMMRDRSDPTAAKVNLFYLVAEWRGVGLGKELDNYAVEFLRSKGFSGAWLRVAPTNTRAIRFYLKRGWTDMGPDARDPETLVMAKRLK